MSRRHYQLMSRHRLGRLSDSERRELSVLHDWYNHDYLDGTKAIREYAKLGKMDKAQRASDLLKERSEQAQKAAIAARLRRD